MRIIFHSIKISTIITSSCSQDALTIAIKQLAFSLGFVACRILPARPPRRAAAFSDWLERGSAASMHYLERSRELRMNPLHLNPQPQSLVVFAMPYPLTPIKPIPTSIATLLHAQHDYGCDYGRIARYAIGQQDYHKTIKPKIIEIDQLVRTYSGRHSPAKGWVDTGPVLERDFAEQAGIGFTGKNTCIINSQYGSWFFIATLWLPECLTYDDLSHFNEKNKTLTWPQWQDPHPPKSRLGGCSDCERCLKACPTNAFVKAYDLEPRQCIAYWTIEAKSAPPAHLRPHFTPWIFGCDICQEVCPWNAEKKTNEMTQNAKNDDIDEYLWPIGTWLPLQQGFSEKTPYWLDDDAFREKFQGTPLMRPGRIGMLRNVTNIFNPSSLSQHTDKSAHTTKEPHLPIREPIKVNNTITFS